MTAMEHSSLLVASATGGVLRRPVQPTPGSAACTTTMASSTVTTTISKTGFLFVVSGINLFYSFGNLINYRKAVEIFLILALFSDLPVYKATYDLLFAVFRFTKDFSKDYKYTFGESLEKRLNCRQILKSQYK